MNTRRAWKDWMRGHGITVVLAVVALAQLRRVGDEDLTRWKGGGFGMYSDFHVKHREVWVHTSTNEAATVHRVSPALQQAASRCTRFANEECLRELETAARRRFPSARRLQVWTFDVEPEGTLFGRRLLAEWTFEGGE